MLQGHSLSLLLYLYVGAVQELYGEPGPTMTNVFARGSTCVFGEVGVGGEVHFVNEAFQVFFLQRDDLGLFVLISIVVILL